MSGQGNAKPSMDRVSRMIRSCLRGAPLQTRESGLRVLRTMQEDVRPEVEDLSRLVLWLTEVHRLDRIEVQKLQGEIGQAGQSTKKRSRFNRLSHGLTFREQWEEAEQKNREQGMDQVSREAMEEAEHARDQFYRDRVGIPGSTVRVDTYGRRVIIVPGDENDTDG